MSEIIVCLQALLAPEKTIRSQAEEHLKKLENQPGYSSELCRLLLDVNTNIAYRQTAGALLKATVKKRWDSQKAVEKGVAPVGDDEKVQLRTVLVPALGDGQALIRVAVAMVIAAIAHEDWPERWPELFPALLNMLHATQESVVHGAMQTLSMLVGEDTISDVYLPLIIRHLFPEILAIFQSNSFSEQIRVKSAQIFEVVVSFICMLNTPEAEELLKSVAGTWIETFIQAVNSSPPSPSRRDYGIACTSISALTRLLKSYPKLLQPYLPSLLPAIWNVFINTLPLYELAIVRGEEEALNGTLGEDGMEIDELAKDVLQFMDDLMEKKSIRKLMEPHLENIIYYSIGYMQLTADQAQLYEMDPNQYIADEEDEAFNYNPRVAATSVLQSIAENYRSKGMQYIYTAIGKRMAESQQYATQPFAWAQREAALLAIGSVAEEYSAHQQKIPPTALPPAALLKDLLLPLLMEQIQEGPNKSGLWYLKGRALWCAAQFAETVDKEASFPFFHACCVLLEPANAGAIPIPVKMAAVKAISRFCPWLPAENLRSYVPGVMQVLCTLIPSASDDSLILLLGSVLTLTKVAPDVTVELAATLGPFVQHVWAHHAADPQLTQDAKEILLELFKYPKGLVAIYPTLSITLHNTFYHPDKLVDMLEAAIDILRLIASITYDPADPSAAQAQSHIHSLIEDLLPPLFNLLLGDTEDLTVRSGSECLSVLIRYTQCVTQAHLESTFKVVHKLFSSKSEIVQRRACELVSRLAAVYPQINSALPELLQKVLQLLAKAQLSDTQQDALLVFIRLINSQYETRLLFDFLAGIPIADTNGLSYLFDENKEKEKRKRNILYLTLVRFFMASWTKYHENLSGALTIKSSIAGLGKVFRTQDPRLDAITVPGQLIVNVNAGRSTRSKKTQNDAWSAVPLRLKILYIFAKEYQELKLKSEESEDDQDDEAVEDEEDEEVIDDLAALMDELDELEEGEDEADEDPLVKLDPLYEVSLTKVVEEVVRQAAQQGGQMFVGLAQQLPADLQQVTQSILQPGPVK